MVCFQEIKLLIKVKRDMLSISMIKLGQETHWVALNIRGDIIEYFDSFGLNCPMEVFHLSNKLRLNYIYNSTQYQNLFSVLCGYYRLFYINESHNGKQYYDILKPFSQTNTNYNEQLITNCLKNT